MCAAATYFVTRCEEGRHEHSAAGQVTHISAAAGCAIHRCKNVVVHEFCCAAESAACDCRAVIVQALSCLHLRGSTNENGQLLCGWSCCTAACRTIIGDLEIHIFIVGCWVVQPLRRHNGSIEWLIYPLQHVSRDRGVVCVGHHPCACQLCERVCECPPSCVDESLQHRATCCEASR